MRTKTTDLNPIGTRAAIPSTPTANLTTKEETIAKEEETIEGLLTTTDRVLETTSNDTKSLASTRRTIKETLCKREAFTTLGASPTHQAGDFLREGLPSTRTTRVGMISTTVGCGETRKSQRGSWRKPRGRQGTPKNPRISVIITMESLLRQGSVRGTNTKGTSSTRLSLRFSHFLKCLLQSRINKPRMTVAARTKERKRDPMSNKITSHKILQKVIKKETSKEETTNREGLPTTEEERPTTRGTEADPEAEMTIGDRITDRTEDSMNDPMSRAGMSLSTTHEEGTLLTRLRAKKAIPGISTRKEEAAAEVGTTTTGTIGGKTTNGKTTHPERIIGTGLTSEETIGVDSEETEEISEAATESVTGVTLGEASAVETEVVIEVTTEVALEVMIEAALGVIEAASEVVEEVVLTEEETLRTMSLSRANSTRKRSDRQP